MVASIMVALLVVASAGGAAHADSRAKDMARAQALFDEGIHLFNMGRFEEACPKFEASLALIAGIGTRGKLAECYEKLGRTASAWRLYREVERLAARSNDDLRRRVAQERARALEPRLARLTILPGPSVALPGFQVRSNNRVVEPRVFGSERIVDPGTYIIVAGAPGHQSWTVTEHVGEGQRATIEVRALVPASDQTGGGVNTQRMAAYSLIGVGLASALGGGAYFGLRARSEWDEAFDKNHCNPDTLECNPMGRELADAANRSANLANLSVGVGLVSITAGVVLWLGSRSEPAPDSPSVSLTPALSQGSLGLVLSSRF